MFGSRVAAILDRLHIGLGRLQWRRVLCLKVPDKPRRPTLRNIEDVIQDQDLAVDIRAGANSDNRNLQRSGNLFSDFVRHTFK